MKDRRIAILAAALAATSAFLGPVAAATATAASRGAVHPAARIVAKERGHGPTLDAAISDGGDQLNGDFYGCQRPFVVVSSGQNADGSWWAVVSAVCAYPR